MELKWKKTAEELPKPYEDTLVIIGGYHYYTVAFYCPSDNSEPIENAHWEVSMPVTGCVRTMLDRYPEYWAYIPEAPND